MCNGKYESVALHQIQYRQTSIAFKGKRRDGTIGRGGHDGDSHSERKEVSKCGARCESGKEEKRE